MTEKIVALPGADITPAPVVQVLREHVLSGIALAAERWREAGEGPPTAVAYVVMNDAGGARTGWHTTECAVSVDLALPRMALALLKEVQR